MKILKFFRKEDKKPTYKCTCCGKAFAQLPLSFGSDYPYYYHSIPVEEREKRVELKQSLCVVDEEHFFHRGRLVIPIVDHNEDLVFDVWTSISPENFEKRMNLWEDENRINEEPYFGWLQTSIPTYGETINIKTIATEQEVGLIPKIKSIEEENPLTFDQEYGITYKKAKEIVDVIMRKEHTGN